MDHNLYLTPDLAHFGTQEKDFWGNFQKIMTTKWVLNIHFSDYASDREHLFPGRGSLP